MTDEVEVYVENENHDMGNADVHERRGVLCRVRGLIEDRVFGVVVSMDGSTAAMVGEERAGTMLDDVAVPLVEEAVTARDFEPPAEGKFLMLSIDGRNVDYWRERWEPASAH